MKQKTEYEAFRDLAEKSKDRLIKLGFPQFTLEDFHDTVRFIDFPHERVTDYSSV